MYWMYPHFYHWMGGHKYIYEKIKFLREKYDLDIRVVAAGFSPYAKEKFEKAGIPMIPLLGVSTNWPLYWLLLPFFTKLEAWYLRNKVGVKKDDLIISCMFPTTVIAQQLTSRHITLCYEPYAFFHDENFLSGFSWPVQLFYRFQKRMYGQMEINALRHAHSIITLSEYNKKWIDRSYGRSDSLVAYEGVDTTFFTHRPATKLKKKYRGKKVILHSTDYTNIKGTPFLIQALPKIKKAVSNIKVIITETIPDSPYKRRVTEMIDQLKLNKIIEFGGFIAYDELPDYLSFATVLVQPSIQQSMNLTVKEAMACGTPIITSPEGEEQTKDGDGGFLVDPHDANLLAEKVIYLLKHPKQAKAMGKRGKKIIQKKFSWQPRNSTFYKAITKEIK